jgi:O-antigen/teichoic acid export membrane protein
MSILRKNVLANFGGKAVTALIGLAVVPVYIKYIGIEAYGLISFFLSIQAVIAILDLGLSSASNREIGIMLSTNAEAGKSRRLLRTMECIYYGVGVIIFLIIALSSDFLTHHWLHTKEITPDTIKICVILAGATIAIRWPISLYSGILLGTERQILFNSINIIIALIKAFGSILVVLYLSNPLVSFYKWNVYFSILEVSIMFLTTWWVLGGVTPFEKKFDADILRNIWQFSLGITGISIFAMLLKQEDKLIISKMLALDQLGFYNTAYLLSTGILLVFQPIQSAVYPRFTRLFAKQNNQQLTEVFHRAAQTVAVLAAPVTCIIIFFSKDLLFLWTHSKIVASQASLSLSLLGCAAFFNSMMGVPFSLQLAAKLTWLPLCNNGIALIIMAPLIYLFVLNFGIWGGALAWLIYNILYYSILPQFMFKHILSGQKKAWYFEDTMPFMVIAAVIFFIIKLVCNLVVNPWGQVITICLGTLMYFVVSILISKTIKSLLLNSFPLRTLRIYILSNNGVGPKHD